MGVKEDSGGVEKRTTRVHRLIRGALKRQDRYVYRVPYDVRLAGRNRKAKLIIDGPAGDIFYIRFTGERLIEEFDDRDVRNEIILHEDTLLDLASAELQLREAIAARLVIITGDRSIYDREEMLQLFERFIADMRGDLRL